MKENTVKRKAGNLARTAVLIFGIGLFFYPDLKTLYMDRCTADMVDKFREKNFPDSDPKEEELYTGADGTGGIRASEELRSMITDYNEKIFAEGQAGFQDAWSVTQSPDVLDGPGDGMFGYIEIPAMDVTLPLYIGASAEHMAKGAAVLGETSIPVGGENTNSVIAGHRGYRGAPYFRDIEELSAGDAVYITNPWETLTYRVESIDIIAPDDSDKVKIQEGKDMVTLLTCHPYRSHGKYRYVVYCVRDGTLGNADPVPAASPEGYVTGTDGNVYESSAEDIRKETQFRKLGALVVTVIICITLIYKQGRKKGDVNSWQK